MDNPGETLITDAGYASAYEVGYTQTIHFLMSRRLSESDAEDIAQEAWLRGWEKRETLRKTSSVVPWINVIALNILRNRYRQDRRLAPLLDRDFAVDPRDVSSRVDAGRLLRCCSLEDRSLLGHLYVGGYTSEETGRRLGLTPGTVRVRIYRAKQRLRARLKRPSDGLTDSRGEPDRASREAAPFTNGAAITRQSLRVRRSGSQLLG